LRQRGRGDQNPDRLFVLAGLKPQPPAPVTEESEAVRLLRELSQDLRGAAVAMLRGLAGEQPVSDLQDEAHGDLEHELLEAFRQLSPRWQEVFVEDARRAAQMGLVRFIGEEAGDDDETGTT